MNAAERETIGRLAAGLAASSGRVSFDAFVAEARDRPHGTILGAGWVNGWDHPPGVSANPIPAARRPPERADRQLELDLSERRAA